LVLSERAAQFIQRAVLLNRKHLAWIARSVIKGQPAISGGDEDDYNYQKSDHD